MNPESYAEWCELSGLYLANHSHLDRYQTYAKSLSKQGLNTVIVSEFLSDISEDLNVDDWRMYNVYEQGNLQSKRVEFTANALNAIGAKKIAKTVQTAKSQSPFDMIRDLDSSDPEAFKQALQKADLSSMSAHLRESMARMMPDVAEQAGIKPTSTPSTSPNSSSTFESREKIEQLLAHYAEIHHAELESDLQKHGDPRETLGFTREARLEELDLRRRCHYSHADQRKDMQKLKKMMTSIENSSEKKRNTDSVRRNFLRLLKDNRNLSDKMLLPEMSSTINEADEFMQRHPIVFERHATDDEQLQSQLATIGTYEIDISGRKIFLNWEQPNELHCDWGRFELALIYPGNKKQNNRALRNLLDAVSSIQTQFAELCDEWSAQLIDHFREYEVQMTDWELEDYTLNADEEVTKESILSHPGPGTITLQAFGVDPDDITAETYFAVDWDSEHGFQIEWDIPYPESKSSGAFLSGDVKMSSSAPQLTDAEITDFEKTFNLKLPKAYRQFLLQHNGGKPEPNHMVLRLQGSKRPIDIEQFYSLPTMAEIIDSFVKSDRLQSIPHTLLPLADISFVGARPFERNSQLFLGLSGKSTGKVFALSTEAIMNQCSIQKGRRADDIVDHIMQHLIGNSPKVAKNLSDLFSKLQTKPQKKIPVWLKYIRDDNSTRFLKWLESGGKLTEKHTGYGEWTPRTVVDYLVEEASLELLQELLNRETITPSDISKSWQSFLRFDISRFRQLMPFLPKSLWAVVFNSSLVWSEQDLLEELAAADIDFDAPYNKEGATLLHRVVRAGNKEAVKWLIEHGADPHKPDKFDRNAFLWAEDGPGFDCLPILEGKDEDADSTSIASPDDPGIAVLQDAVEKLTEGISLNIVIEIKTPPVTRIEKAYYHDELFYILTIDLSREQLTFKDKLTPRQSYLHASGWPGILFAPILQWPDLTPVWDTLEVHEFDWAKGLRKRNYEPLLREDLREAACSALKQAFDLNEAEARRVRLRK